MTLINLENYLNKEAEITLHSGDTRTGRVTYSNNKSNPNTKYVFENVSHYNKFGEAFSSDGTRSRVTYDFDIVEIKLIGNVKTEGSNDVVQAIASALKEEALQYVQSDNKFADVVVELLDEYIRENLGNLNKNVKGDVIQNILDSMVLS